MLRCLSRYRNASLSIFVEPGEVLNKDPELEGYLLRDSPGSFEVVTVKVVVKAPEAPPVHKMMEREEALRKLSERHPGGAMSRRTNPGIVAPKE